MGRYGFRLSSSPFAKDLLHAVDILTGLADVVSATGSAQSREYGTVAVIDVATILWYMCRAQYRLGHYADAKATAHRGTYNVIVLS